MIIGAQYTVTQDFIDHYKINMVVCGEAEIQQNDPLTGMNPFEAAKKAGKFKLINSGSDVTAAKIIQRIADNR